MDELIEEHSVEELREMRDNLAERIMEKLESDKPDYCPNCGEEL